MKREWTTDDWSQVEIKNIWKIQYLFSQWLLLILIVSGLFQALKYLLCQLWTFCWLRLQTILLQTSQSLQNTFSHQKYFCTKNIFAPREWDIPHVSTNAKTRTNLSTNFISRASKAVSHSMLLGWLFFISDPSLIAQKWLLIQKHKDPHIMLLTTLRNWILSNSQQKSKF